MNNPNPFIPQGSLLEQHKRRSRMKLAVFCVLAVSVCSLTAILIEGCKRENESTQQDTNEVTTAETNVQPLEASNPPVTAPAMPTNQTVVAPPIAPPPVVAPPEEESSYVVVKGDTLGKIAKAHGVSLKALEAANPDVQPAHLKIGEKLTLPAPSATASAETAAGGTDMSGEETYVVKSGDTLTKIARTHGTTVKAIEAENNLTTTRIKVGQKLKIPANANTTVNTPPETAPAPVAPQPAAPAPEAPAPAAPPANGQ